MMIIRPEVRAQFPEFTVKFEGRVPTMYADVFGLITIGLGCLIDPVRLAADLPFQLAHGAPASRAEIVAEWSRLKVMNLGHWHYRVQAARAGLRLSLSDDAIDDLARTRLDLNAAELLKHFPLFESWPATAQLATLSMAWAAGGAFALKFPRFAVAARRNDWARCALECRLRETGADGTPNPGVIPRNRANAALFTAAAAPPPLPDVSLLPGPTIDHAKLEYMITVWLDDQIHGERP